MKAVCDVKSSLYKKCCVNKNKFCEGYDKFCGRVRRKSVRKCLNYVRQEADTEIRLKTQVNETRGRFSAGVGRHCGYSGNVIFESTLDVFVRTQNSSQGSLRNYPGVGPSLLVYPTSCTRPFGLDPPSPNGR